MAGEIGNPLGYVPVFGEPNTITGYAIAVVSGGAPVYASGAAGNVGSQTESYATTDINFLTAASGALFNGVAMETVASGAPVTVATRGVVIGVAIGTVTAGTAVAVDDGGFVNLGSEAASTLGFYTFKKVGRALSSAASGSFFLLDLNP